jgi:hypothetical protein
MPWTCVQCSTANDDRLRHCGQCGAVLPFSPPVDAELEESPVFEVPRRGEMTAGLKHGLDSLRAGSLSLDEFLEKIDLATQNVPVVFAAILDGLEEPDQDLSGYVDGVKTSLLDCQTLFLSGLDEMSRFGEDEDPFHLRFGWLLVEKGEQEYVQIIETLNRDAGGGKRLGTPDLLGHLADRLASGEIQQEEYLEHLERFEESARQCLDRAQRLIESGIESARQYDGEDEAPFQAASEQAAQAADELGALVLNLYHS